MAKIVLKRIKAGSTSTTALNANFDRITTAIENTLSRDGTTPNQMSSSLDMNSQRIINLQEPIGANDAARLVDVQNLLGGGDDEEKADVDLGNVLGEDLATKTLAIRTEADAAVRSLRSKLSEHPSINDWQGATFTEKLQNAIDDLIALGGGVIYLPGGSYSVTAQIILNGSNITFVGDGKGRTNINCTYTGGPCFLIGDDSTSTNEVIFQDIWISGGIGVTLFQTRCHRTLSFYDCRVGADQFGIMGDATLGALKYAYVFNLYNCEMNHLGAATKDFLVAENFLGQMTIYNTFLEGQHVSGLDGFSAAGNLVDIEHVVIVGGYWSRFHINWNLKGCRAVSWFFVGHYSEGAAVNAILFDVDGEVLTGFKNIHIINCVTDSTQEGVVFRVSSSGKTGETVFIDNLSHIGTATRGAVFIDAQTGTTRNITIKNVTVQSNLSAASTYDGVLLKGLDGSITLTDVSVDGINARALSANTFRSSLRIEGAMNARIIQGTHISGGGVDKFVDDASGVAYRSSEGDVLQLATVNFGTVSANSSTTQTVTIVPSFFRNATNQYFVSFNIVGGTAVNPAINIRAAVTGSSQVTFTAYNNSGSGVTADNVQVFIKVERFR